MDGYGTVPNHEPHMVTLYGCRAPMGAALNSPFEAFSLQGLCVGGGSWRPLAIAGPAFIGGGCHQLVQAVAEPAAACGGEEWAWRQRCLLNLNRA